MQPDILIQNVSSQCIPNLVALKTFRPRLVVWVGTAEMQTQIGRLQKSAAGFARQQQVWQVNARDVEALHAEMLKGFASLQPSGPVIYHLTGGTKSMALQGLYNLSAFRRSKHADVLAVVMDPHAQAFDAIFPRVVNGYRACARLSLDDMLLVHGMQWDKRHRSQTFAQCAKRKKLWALLRSQAPRLKRHMSLNSIRALHARPLKGPKRHFRYADGSLPGKMKEMLHVLADHGLITNLRWPSAAEFAYNQTGPDIIKLLNGSWLEYWAGSVLHDCGIAWQGGAVSAKLLEPEGGSQEFDVLAAERNRLVYWSCKTDTKLTNDKLFEVDALRDGIAGADFHVAGLLHMGAMSQPMRNKARRMGLKTLDVLAPDAEEQLIRASGG